MFENLTNKFEEIFSSLKKAASLDENQVDEGLKGIRQALIEADVSLDVTKDFIEKVKPKVMGQEIIRSTSPGDVDLIISCPKTFGLTFDIKSFATSRDTSASKRACLIPLKPSSTCFSSSEGAFFKEEKISSNLFVKFSNIFITHSSFSLVGEYR